MFCRRITAVLVFVSVTLLAAQETSNSSDKTSCKMIIPSLLAESGINTSKVLRCGDPISPLTASTSQCLSDSRNVIYCTSPIVVRYKSRDIANADSNSLNGSSMSVRAISECLNNTSGKCTRRFHTLFNGILEIPRTFDITSIYPTIANDISLISLADCKLLPSVQNTFCEWENETNIDQPTSSLLGLLRKYLTGNESKIIIRIVIDHNSFVLECEINSTEPSTVKLLAFNSSLEGMVSYSVFSSIPEVKVVQIQSLTLSHTPSDLFLNNSKLTTCTIRQTMLEDVHPQLFTSATELEVVDFSDNRLQTLPEGLFQHNIHLRTLCLAGNQIRFLPTKLMERCHSLSILDLSDNPLQDLQLSLMTNPPETTYANFTSARTVPSTFARRYKSWLTDATRHPTIANAIVRSNAIAKIDVSYGQLQKIPDGALDGSIVLTVFRADHNAKLQSLHGSHSFYALQEFSASNCSITSIDEDFFAKSDDNKPLFVKKIDLSQNKIRVLRRRTFWNCNELQILLLSKNRVFKLERGLFKDLFNLQQLDVSGNMLSTFQSEAFSLRNIVRLDFSWNRVNAFQPEEMIFLFEKNIKGFPKQIDLSHNCLTSKKIIMPSVNDARRLYLKFVHVMYTHLKPNDTAQDGDSFLINVKQINARHDLNINYENARDEAKQLVLEMTVGPADGTVSLCRNPLRTLCIYFPLACKDSTKEAEEEFYTKLRYVNILGCKEISVEDNSAIEDAIKCPFTPKCPADHYRSILDNVKGYEDRISTFTCPVTTSCPSPCSCYKRAIENELVVNCSHRGLPRLPTYAPTGTKILYLNNNELQSLAGLNTPVWLELRELYLENNLISSIKKEYLPPNLKRISLKNNNIESIDNADIDALSNIDVFLSGNPWRCDCKAVFLKTQLKVLNIVPDAESIFCASSNTSLLNSTDGVLCPSGLQVAQNISLTVSLGISLPVVAGILILLYYRNKELVKAFILTKFPFVFNLSRRSDVAGAGKRFDAFVSYSNLDRDIVMQMIEELESKEPYFKLCIHERDWMPGNEITANIAKSVSSSRKTIFIVSMDFLRSMWFPVELSAAYHQMQEDKKNCAIIIIKGDIPPKRELNEQLQILLKTKTYLVWGEHWFWEKLRYALYKNVHKECLLSDYRPNSDFVERIAIDIRKMDVSVSEV